MDLRTFHARTYAKHLGRLFVFEPTWDSFRPISNIGWDGKKYAPSDSEYTSNVFCPHYGFASLEEKKICSDMVESTNLDNVSEILDAVEFWRWAGLQQKTEWFRDRPCVFLTPCSPRNWKQYLLYEQSRPRTVRRPPRGSRTTRRSKRLVTGRVL